jgi:predicted Fe-Mo cluster-binding NifX family protein
MTSMICALSIWNGRIAPVFDSSNRVLIIDDDSALNAIERAFRAEGPLERAVFLRDLGVGTLVCGAISREYEWALLESGIDLLSFIAGSVDDVIAAWTRGSLERSAFSMPGCPCPRRRRCRGRGGSLRFGR